MSFSLHFSTWIINNLWYSWASRHEKGGALEWNPLLTILKHFKQKLNMVLLDFFGVSSKVTLNLFFRSICQDLLYAWRKEIRQEENNH